MSSEIGRGVPTDLVPPYDASAETLEVLAHPRRARTIRILRGRERSLATTDLATHLVARERDVALIEVSESAHESAFVALRHSHLPALSDHDLVEWDREERAVDPGPAVPDAGSKLCRLLESRPDSDAVYATLSNGRRRATLSILDDLEGSVSVTELSKRVAAREIGGDASAVGESERQRIEVSLHHSHLPALAGAGLLEYDPDANEVALDDHPLLAA